MFQESGATPLCNTQPPLCPRDITHRRAGREETRGDAARDAETTDDDARVVCVGRATRATARAT